MLDFVFVYRHDWIAGITIGQAVRRLDPSARRPRLCTRHADLRSTDRVTLIRPVTTSARSQGATN